MAFLKWTVICSLFVFLQVVNGAGKIHRAVSRGKTKNGVNVNSDIGDMSDLSPNKFTPWFYSIPATLLVGLTGVFPLLVIPVEAGHKLREGVSADRLKLLLSFAVGGLLGDVFLHLLPEAFAPVKEEMAHDENLKIGLWIIGGLLTFLVLEKIFQERDEGEPNAVTNHEIKSTENSQEVKSDHCEQNGYVCNGPTSVLNGHATQNGCSDVRKRVKETKSESSEETKECRVKESHSKSDGEKEDVKVVGYLNLLANCIDNFTHGLAVSGSFLVSTKVGLLTTFAILLHEIPHEIGDFAILLKSGFRRWDAACGQIMTATGGLFGAVFGLVVTEAGDSTCWVLPFTSGGFIYISLVTIVPELLEESRPWESFKQLVCLIAGITAMGLVSLIH